MTPVPREGQEQEEQLPGGASEEALAVEAGAADVVVDVAADVDVGLEEAKLRTKNGCLSPNLADW